MEDSVANEDLAPESWESADVDESLRRLMLKDPEKEPQSTLKHPVRQSSAPCLLDFSFPSAEKYVVEDKVSFEDSVNGVDQFLREALQNPRERLSVLRLEQDVEKFIRDPLQHQMEFPQLPTSYLRLAAHRVAQHYSLQSMVLLDNVLPDGSRIVIRKTPETKLPLIRLADIPLNYPSEESGNIKVAIKQRPRKQSGISISSCDGSSKGNSSKTVEERKEEYNKARARIFNSTNSEPRIPNTSKSPPFMVKSEEKDESSTSKDPLGRNKMNNRVAIFRDREIEKKDPDYDRSYDRYVQRFDPGFGFNTGQYPVKPLYAPAVNYNTEFPQLGSNRRPQGPSELMPHQHLPVQWSNPPGVGFNPDVMGPYNPNHSAPRSPSTVYMHSQYPMGVTYMHPSEYVQHFQVFY